MRPSVLWFLVLLLVSTGCAQARSPDQGGPGPHSGVRGIVLLGPTCPVETVDSPCPDQPLEANVRVSGPGGTATVRSGRNGTFQIFLEPGRYALRALASGVQTSKPVAVTVIAGRWANVTLSVDSGIR
jgi:hypothetical protein